MRRFPAALLFCCNHANVKADELLTIDDRLSGDDHSSPVSAWRLITECVMGGVSIGRLTLDRIGGRDCSRALALYG